MAYRHIRALTDAAEELRRYGMTVAYGEGGVEGSPLMTWCAA
jgi:hypothetical protein